LAGISVALGKRKISNDRGLKFASLGRLTRRPLELYLLACLLAGKASSVEM
jgi:hypothetical protein